MSTSVDHARIVSTPGSARFLDAVQLQRLERAFCLWAELPGNRRIRESRRRIFLIFLLIRYTGARLREVLHMEPHRDIDFADGSVRLRKKGTRGSSATRCVRIPDAVASQILALIEGFPAENRRGRLFAVDPGHVRRKFYERAQEAGIAREAGAPEVIRKSRAVELMQRNMPLPVVQRMLGHSTPNLAASYVEFSDNEVQQVQRYYVERENSRKTSARNAFFGKIDKIRRGDIQAMVEIVSVGGLRISSVITNDSLERMGLKPGALVAAEVKAPWVSLCKGSGEPSCSAENRFSGTVLQVLPGKTTAEIVVGLQDGTRLCAVVTEKSRGLLSLEVKEAVWAVFNAFSVVIHTD